MELFYDVYGRTEPSEIYLARPGRKITNALNGVDKTSVNFKLNGNSTHELSFDVWQYIEIDGKTILSNDYNLIDEMMEIFCCGVWFKIVSPPQTDNSDDNEIKHVECESSEIELQQYNLTNFKVNCGTEDSCEMLASNNIVTDKNGLSLPKANVKLYNSKNPELSLIDLILKYADVPNWHVGTVDRGVYDNEEYYVDTGNISAYQWLEDMVSNFNVDNQDVYSFLTNDVANAFRCIITFNTNDYTINLYRLEGIGKDTNVYIGYRNLQSSFSATRDSSLYTVFTVSGADSLGIQYVNFGTSRIENISYFLNTKYLSQSIIDKYKSWQKYRESKRKSYMSYSRQYNSQLDVVSEIKNRVPIDACETDWSTFPDQDLQDELSLYQAQVLAYQRLYVDSAGNFDLSALKSSSDWPRYKQITEYVIPNIEIQIRNNQVPNKDDWEESITAWETDWELYGTSELSNKLKSYDDSISTLRKNKFDGEYDSSSSYTKDYFDEMHKKYIDTVKLRSQCQTALDQRTKEYNTAESTLNSINASRTALVNDVEISNPNFNFTKEELNIIKKLYNQTSYKNENILVTSIDDTNDEIDEQYKLYLDAKNQLYVESHPQWTYENSLDNLFAMPEFKYMHEPLDIFNFIRIETRPNNPVKLRVISIEFNPCLLENDLKISFTTMVNYASKRNDFVSLMGDTVSKSSKSIISGGSSGDSSLEYTVDAALIKKILSSPTFTNYSSSLYVDYIAAASATFGKLKADYINTGQLAADIANITELHSDSAFVNYLKSSLITTENLISLEGYVGNAQISELSANKITSGTLNAAIVTIAGSEGKLQIVDNTIQIFDDDHVRVQIGKDASGDYTLAVWDVDGNLIWDALGATEYTIQRKIIRDKMVADDANIQGYKLDIDSVVTSINGSTTKIDGTIVQVGNKTLNIALSEQTQTITNQGEILTDHAAKIAANESAISLKVDTQTYETDKAGIESSLNKAVSDISVLENQISLKVWQTDIEKNLEGYSTTEQMLAEIELSKTGIMQTVSSTYATKDNLNAAETRISTAESQISQNADEISLRVKESDMTGNYLIGKINLTGTTAIISAERINLTGAVTISSLSDSALSTIKGYSNTALADAKTYADSGDSTTLSSAKSYAANAVNWVSTNSSNMTDLRAMILTWTNNAVSTSTYFQGGWIATNTITAEKIALGDFTNYASWKDKTAATCPFSTRPSTYWAIDTSVYRTSTASYKYTSGSSVSSAMSGIKIPVTVGEVIYIEYYYKTDAGWTCDTGNSKLRFANAENDLLANWGISSTEKTSWTKVTGTYTVTSSAGAYISVGLYIRGTTAGKRIWIDDIVIKKMAIGELIVDGSITTGKLAANAVTADKITTSNIVGTNGWINLHNGTFNYGNGKLVWNGSTLSIEGKVTTTSGKIGIFNINNALYTNANAFGTTANNIYIGSSGISLGTTFKVTNTGSLTATSGTISGWTIGSTSIRSLSSITEGTASTQYDALMGRYASATGSAFLVRSREYNGSEYGDWTTNFQVRYDGKMIANNASVKGTITATAGKVGVFNIDSALYTSTNAFGTTANNIYIGSSGISLGTNFQVTKAGTLTAVNAILKNVLYMRSTGGTTNRIALSVTGNGDVTDLTIGSGYTQILIPNHLYVNATALFTDTITVNGMVSAPSFSGSGTRADIACNSNGWIAIGSSTLTYKSIIIDPRDGQGYLRPSVSGNYSLGSTAYKFYSGYFSNTVTAAAWNTSSLAEIKQDIHPCNNSALSVINSSKIYTYRLKDDVKHGRNFYHTGFVIGEGYDLSDSLLSENKDAIDMYSGLAYTVKAIQELDIKANETNSKIVNLEAQNASMSIQIAQLFEENTKLKKQLNELLASA